MRCRIGRQEHAPIELWNEIQQPVSGENVTGDWFVEDSEVNAVIRWMNSEGHRKNILNSDFNKIGCGWAYCPARNHIYWTCAFSG